MKIAVVCAPGLGDALILHIVSYHLKLAGHTVTTVTPHRFGNWVEGDHEEQEVDALFLQYDNSERARELRQQGNAVYIFYGDYKPAKHGPLRVGFDYACDPHRTMVDNAIFALEALFQIRAHADNGFRPPKGLGFRRHRKRVAIHSTSGHPSRNWPVKKFLKVSQWLASEGFEPVFLPHFPQLEDLLSFIYESGYFLGNDSGPGHIASCLHIPHLIIGREERHMRHWRPGWGFGEIITPPTWVPNWKGWRLREKKWGTFITTRSVINKLKESVLQN